MLGKNIFIQYYRLSEKITLFLSNIVFFIKTTVLNEQYIKSKYNKKSMIIKTRFQQRPQFFNII